MTEIEVLDAELAKAQKRRYPLAEHLVLLDLRRLPQDARRPSARQLARRWVWSLGRVRRLLARVAR